MKNYVAVLVVTAGLLSCHKEKADTGEFETAGRTAAAPSAASACTVGQYALSVDINGRGRFFKVSTNPATAASTYTPVNGSCSTNIINGANLAQVLKPTGLALASGGLTAIVCTGVNGVAPNKLYRFPTSNPCSPSVISLSGPTGFYLNISDLERNPYTGDYFAINTDATGNNEVVKVDVSTGVVTRLPAGSLGPLQLKGLTFWCDPSNTNAFVYQDSGPTGNILQISITTGNIAVAASPYGGPVNPSAWPDMGLTADCFCTDFLMTCNGSPGATSPLPLFTVGLPVSIGTAYVSSSSSTLRPTFDFGKW